MIFSCYLFSLAFDLIELSYFYKIFYHNVTCPKDERKIAPQKYRTREYNHLQFVLYQCHHIFLLPFRDINKTKPRIHQFTNLKCCKRPESLLKLLFDGVLLLIYYFRHLLKACHFILETLKRHFVAL